MSNEQANAARLWEKVDRGGEDECWLWTGYVRPDGYGQLGKNKGAHRLAYELAVGSVPEGLVLDHLCRTRHCCNPAHLEPVTVGENFRRGEGVRPNAEKTHCIHGHRFDVENTYITPRGGRNCRQCLKLAQRRVRERRRAAA